MASYGSQIPSNQSYVLYNNTWATDPGNGNAAWTNTSLNSLQVGEQTVGATTGVNVSQVFVNVTYTSSGSTTTYGQNMYWDVMNMTSDDTPPVATFGTNPVDNYNSTSSTVIFDAKCSDDISLSSLKIFGNWSGWSSKVTQSNPTNDTWYNLSIGSIPDGTWLWGIYCADNNGNTAFSSANRTFTIDTTPPSITIVSPLSNYYNTQSIWFNATLNEPGSWCGYSLDGAMNVSMTNSSGNWNKLSAIAEGSHSAVFFCNDTTGNMGNAGPITFYVDVTPPVASFGTNPVDTYNSSNSSVTFDGMCSDNAGVSWIQIWGNWAGTWAANYSNSSYTNNTWLNITVAGIPDGSNYQWAVWCNDTSGNTNITTNRTLNVNTPIPDNPPTVTLNLPGNNSTDTDGNVTFNCSANDDYQLVNLTLYVWNSSALYYNNTVGISGIGNSSSWNLTNMPNDIYNWNCLAYDNASQSSWATSNRTVTVNTSYGGGSSYIIGECRAINSPGYYQLNQTIQNGTNCIWINSSNVILDCQNNLIEYAYSGSGIGINIIGENNVTVDNCVIEQNISTYPSSHGIYLAAYSNISLNGNEVTTRGSSSHGIYLSSGGSYYSACNLTDNRLYIYGDNSEAVYIEQSLNNQLIDNSISLFGTNEYGIYAHAGSNNNLFDYNNVTSSATGDIGIYIYSSSNNNTLKNNNIVIKTNGGGYPAYYISLSDYTNSSNNYIYTDTGGADLIKIENSHHDVFNNENITPESSASGYGLYVINSTDINFTNGYIESRRDSIHIGNGTSQVNVVNTTLKSTNNVPTPTAVNTLCKASVASSFPKP